MGRSYVVTSAPTRASPKRPRTGPEALGRPTGWVNNAAVFRDAALDTAPASNVLALGALDVARRRHRYAARDDRLAALHHSSGELFDLLESPGGDAH